VMAQVVASPVRRPIELAVPDATPAPVPTSVLPGLPIYTVDGPVEWQRRLAGYLRGAAAVALSLLGTVGLLLALVMSNTLIVGEPFTPIVELARTVVNSASTWARSLPLGVGPGALTVGGLLLGSLLLVGWQVVAGYQRAMFEQNVSSGYFEAAA